MSQEGVHIKYVSWQQCTLPGLSCGCETWSLQGLQVTEKNVLKIINVLWILSGWKQAVLLALNNCAPLAVLCIAQYYAVMVRGEGSRYILLGPANPTGPWDLPTLNMFFSDHTNITGITHFFACLSRLVYTSYNISFIFLCKILCYKDQSHFGTDAVLTADIAASMFRILTRLDE